MNWHISQEIVAIKSVDDGIKKDSPYTINGLKVSPCNCKMILIDVGIKAKGTHDLCRICNYEEHNIDRIWWFSENCFKPLDELSDITELTELLEGTKAFEVNKK